MRLRLKALAALDAKKTPCARGARRPSGGARRRRRPGQGARRRRRARQLLRADRARPRRARHAERTETLATFDAALQRLEGDTTLSRADRMQALIARIDLARIDLPEPVAGKPAPQPKLPSRCSRTCATRRRAPTARSPTATSARR
jgi:hypothetical protein